MNDLNQAMTRDSASQSCHPDAVSLRGLTRRFGANTVLHALDLDLAPGSFTALLGRSGSGKSTLLRTLAGLDPRPADAQLVVPPRSTVVFQEPRLLPWRSVWRNVAIGLHGADVRGRAKAALAEVSLSHRVDAWPVTLSGGEAQRAALARALVREPRLLLLDEPFAALDALTRLRMQALVIDLWKVHSPTTLLVTHDVDEAIAMADRALVLEGGRIAADVTIDLPRCEDRHAMPEFGLLRHRLLELLGVHGPLPAAAAARPPAAPAQRETEPEPVA
jgi:sulfonate transport system ATP-binding protein